MRNRAQKNLSVRIELDAPDHLLAQTPRFTKRCLLRRAECGVLGQQAIELLIKKTVNQFQRVTDWPAVVVKNIDSSGVLDALRNHQPVNPVIGEVFHVAVEKTCPAAVQHAVALANHTPHGRPSADPPPIATPPSI